MRKLTFSATDPFDSHFSVPTEDDLSPKIQAVEKNNWNMAKKEINGLRLIRGVPKHDGSEATLLPAMKSMANVKVSGIGTVTFKYTNTSTAQKKTGISRQGVHPQH